jgi:hypothetical protein
MARDRSTPSEPSPPEWDRVLALFRDGAPEFVAQLRQISNANAVAPFAEKWYTDNRPEARRLLFAYLAEPLNAPRHEPLVKRLFKFADNAGDDVAMAHFLVAFDRTIRRQRRKVDRWNYRTRALEQVETIAVPPGTTLPRDDRLFARPWSGGAKRERLTEGKFLFSPKTRRYLRRRAWRYFRKLGKKHPERYVPGVCTALKLYTDADTPSGLGMLDNWGLVHILFHHSPTLRSTPRGWQVAPGGQLTQLQPDPKYRKLWLQSAEPIFDVLVNARCRAVSLWALKMLRRHFPERLARVETPELLRWLIADNAILNDLAIELLQSRGGLEKIPAEEWLKLIEAARPDLMDRICDMILRAVKPEQVSFTDAVRLAMLRPIPLARLGRAFLKGKKPATDDEVRAVFGLREAEAVPLRADLVRWAVRVLSGRPDFEPLWVLEFLDSRHDDVREIGWEWLLSDERAREDTGVWQRLLESPYDNIRLRMIAMLEERAKFGDGTFSPETVRGLWASALLNVQRGSRVKPVVVRQVMARLATHPGEGGELLPIIAVVLRSIRGPEFRAGLAGIAAYLERNPERRSLVEAVFPELKWSLMPTSA